MKTFPNYLCFKRSDGCHPKNVTFGFTTARDTKSEQSSINYHLDTRIIQRRVPYSVALNWLN